MFPGAGSSKSQVLTVGAVYTPNTQESFYVGKGEFLQGLSIEGTWGTTAHFHFQGVIRPQRISPFPFPISFSQSPLHLGAESRDQEEGIYIY